MGKTNAVNSITEEQFFQSFMGVDELDIPYSQTYIQLLEFDVNRRNYKEVDSIRSVEAIVHGAYSGNNIKVEITFNPKLKSEIKKMKQFIKRVEDSRKEQGVTNKPAVLNVSLSPTRQEFMGSQVFMSNPMMIETEEHGFLFNKNLTAHIFFPVSNVQMNIVYNPEAKAKVKSKKQVLTGKSVLDSIGRNKSGNLKDQNNEVDGNKILDDMDNEDDEIEKEPVTQRQADEIAEDDVSYTKLVGSKNPQEDLDRLIGLENVKEKIKQMEARMLFEKRKKEAGIKETRASNRHMIFYGEPGTGKTTVARIMTGILYDMGLIRKNQCIEVNGEMLKGRFMGASAPKTQRMVNRAMGGVLFIDEAYTIMDNFSSGGGYGKEVISVLLKSMEDHKDDLIIIFAGYEKEMEEFLDTNPGLNSRIGDKIKFVRYQPEALIEIFNLMLQGHGLDITREAHIHLFNRLFDAYNNEMTSGQNGNARYVENLVEKVVDLHAHEAIKMDPDDPMMFVVQKDVIDEVFKLVPQTLNEDQYITLEEGQDPYELVFETSAKAQKETEEE